MLLLKINHSEHCKDDKRKSFYEFYFNGSLILKQKIPFDSNYEEGFNTKYSLKEVYLLGYNIFQTRDKRNVKFPISKKILKILEYNEQEKYPLKGYIKFGKIFLKE